MIVKKEDLYKIINDIPDRELVSALRYLQYLRDIGEDPVLRSLNAAALDEEPLTVQEAQASDASWRSYLNGDDTGKSLDEYLSDKND